MKIFSGGQTGQNPRILFFCLWSRFSASQHSRTVSKSPNR